MKYVFILACSLLTTLVLAQPSIKVEVSVDTAGVGEVVELTYTIENGQGNFMPPDMDKIPVASGPSTSTSMLYQNGKMSSSQSYTYYIVPEEEGTLTIPEASYKENGKVTAIDPVEIVVTKYSRGRGGIKSKPAESATETKPVREKRKI